FKLECLKIKHHFNHFALRSKIYLKALKSAYDELQVLKAA
ncbi:MAG: IS701 family transposase, partial [Candidatus Thermoplasmatota archaeon]|nr:IS701 family transposase [Candidatus Thermoplasmatota archaeon]